MRKTVSGILLFLLLVSTLTVAFNIQPAKAEGGTIYIRADGSIDPPDAPIITVDNVIYTLTANITSNASGIVVERDNIVVDGAGYTLQGTGGSTSYGIDISGRRNITIKNINIENFGYGIYLLRSSLNTILNNNAGGPISLKDSPHNTLKNNTMWRNFYISGSDLSHYLQDIDTSNKINGNFPIYYLVNERDKVIDKYSKAGFVAAINSENITVKGLDEWSTMLRGNSHGVLFVNTNNSKIESIKAYYNQYQICLLNSFNNVVSRNYWDRSGCSGIYLLNSSENIFTNNEAVEAISSSFSLYNSSNNIISNNILKKLFWSDYEIYLERSNNNLITNNDIILTEPHGGYTQGAIFLHYSNNNTILSNYLRSIGLRGINNWIALIFSSNNKILCNNIRFNEQSGISIGWNSSYNIVFNNTILQNIGGSGIALGSYAFNNTVSNNNIDSNGGSGISLGYAFYNLISNNSISWNSYGINVHGYSSGNKIYHNNFINNLKQSYLFYAGENFFDDGYPSGGNYWSDYINKDEFSGPHQDQPGSDGIWDNPYVINSNNKDRYPLVNPWTPTPNQPPYDPAAVSQYRSDGVTVIPEGGTTPESTVVFKATVSDPNGDSVRLEIELRRIGEPFTGEPTPETISDFVPSGSQVTITRSGLVNADYHWRYRAKDIKGAASDWTEFGTAGNIDFSVSVTYQPPIADFTYSPLKPLIGEEITFNASASFDPDGGNIVSYEWNFGDGSTAYGEIPLPHSYSVARDYTVTLTVTDDEGTTNSKSMTVKVTKDWNFVIITDLHIGYGFPDYGTSSWNDSGGQDWLGDSPYWLTKRLRGIVNWINEHEESDNIHFVVVLGDISDSGEKSELLKARDILNGLNVPYIPVIGNHDIWPYTQEEKGRNWRDIRDKCIKEYATTAIGDEFFYEVFWRQNSENVQKIKELFGNSFATQTEEIESLCMNYAFVYKGIKFIALDFVDRNPDPKKAPQSEGPKLNPDTRQWLTVKLNENVALPTILLSHHPMWVGPGGFNPSDLLAIRTIISGKNILANFAGHVHYDKFLEDWSNWEAGIDVVTTEAVCRESCIAGVDRTGDNIRIVTMSGEKIEKWDTLYSIGDETQETGWERFLKSWKFWVRSPVDVAVTDPEGFTITKEIGEVSGMFYVEFDWDGDDKIDEMIIIDEVKVGDYQITVIPESGASPTDMYTLLVWGQDAAIVLAENVSISDIPAEPYIVSSTAFTLNVPPTTLLDVGEPKCVVDGVTYLTSATLIELIAHDNPYGSGLSSTAYRIYNATYDTGWITYMQPIYLTGLTDGAYCIDYYSVDFLNNTESTNTITVILDNTPPEASFTWTPSIPKVGETVTFDASASTSNGVTIVSYEWDFGDGGHANGKIVTHTYTTAGTYTVTLNVTDSLGFWDIEQKQIQIEALPPPPLSASISPLSASILVGQSVTFTSTVSGGYTPYSYQWFLNGNPVSGATSASWTFIPTSSGIYYVHLKVTDDKGNTAQSGAARITVATVPVGGYSIPMQLPATAKPVTMHIALLTILTAIFITIKRKTKRKH